MATRTVESITFTGSQGMPLAARLDRPGGAIRAYAVFAHCFTIIGELSNEQRQRLLEIAERCPVHRTLTSDVMITGVEATQM